jgi:hypothetical protein
MDDDARSELLSPGPPACGGGSTRASDRPRVKANHRFRPLMWSYSLIVAVFCSLFSRKYMHCKSPRNVQNPIQINTLDSAFIYIILVHQLTKSSLFPTMTAMAHTYAGKACHTSVGLPLQVLRLRKLRRQVLCMCGLSRHHGRSLIECDPTLRRKLWGSVELMLEHAGG